MVDFPQPLGPTMATERRAGIVTLTSRRIGLDPSYPKPTSWNPIPRASGPSVPAPGASPTSGRSARSAWIRRSPAAACWKRGTTPASCSTADTMNHTSSKKAISEPTDSSPRSVRSVPTHMAVTSTE